MKKIMNEIKGMKGMREEIRQMRDGIDEVIKKQRRMLRGRWRRLKEHLRNKR